MHWGMQHLQRACRGHVGYSKLGKYVVLYIQYLQRNTKKEKGVGYGMEMDSYKSQILDGGPDGSGTKTKSY